MDDLWVFGYGSLMWRPGFPFIEAREATLEKYHRSFCVYSRYWRGTPSRPGLVLGLTPGGSCRGLAFRVAAQERDNVIEYLNERELSGYAYLGLYLPVQIGSTAAVNAYVFVADEKHRHYAGDLPVEQAAQIIMEAEGKAGLNREYLIYTIRELEHHGFAEPDLQRLRKTVEALTGTLESGSGI